MEKFFIAGFHGLYIPIVVCSGFAAALFAMRLLIPAARSGELTLSKYAIGLSSVLSLAAHFAENLWYGVFRWTGASWMNDSLAIVGAWKIAILASCAFAIVALNTAQTDRQNLQQVLWGIFTLWAAGTLLALIF